MKTTNTLETFILAFVMLLAIVAINNAAQTPAPASAAVSDFRALLRQSIDRTIYIRVAALSNSIAHGTLSEVGEDFFCIVDQGYEDCFKTDSVIGIVIVPLPTPGAAQ